MNFDDMTKEEYDLRMLLKDKSRMEQDEILRDLERSKVIWQSQF
jgi:hypothetical protein